MSTPPENDAALSSVPEDVEWTYYRRGQDCVAEWIACQRACGDCDNCSGDDT